MGSEIFCEVVIGILVGQIIWVILNATIGAFLKGLFGRKK